MDKSIPAKHIEMIQAHYPGMNLLQLGLVCTLLGAIRASMGHESVSGTIENYIHPKQLTPDVRQCLDFIEREILAIKRSKIDVDYWKRGNTGSFRRSIDKVEV